jgi:hypothetical protein
MKPIMHTAALAAALTLAACGGGGDQANVAAGDNLAMDNMSATDPAAMNAVDANMMMDANMTTDANMAVDANTQNAMMNDLKTNDPDTNLANGM